MLMFDDLRYDDYLHHILMFPFAGLAGLIFLRKSGFNFAIFALTGLPGGIDFLLLTLVKLGYIDRYTEKRLNIYIQVWFRMPLLIFNCGIFYAELFEGHISPWCLIGVILSAWNGIFYMHDTLCNYYHKHYETVLNMHQTVKTINNNDSNNGSSDDTNNDSTNSITNDDDFTNSTTNDGTTNDDDSTNGTNDDNTNNNTNDDTNNNDDDDTTTSLSTDNDASDDTPETPPVTEESN